MLTTEGDASGESIGVLVIDPVTKVRILRYIHLNTPPIISVFGRLEAYVEDWTSSPRGNNPKSPEAIRCPGTFK